MPFFSESFKRLLERINSDATLDMINEGSMNGVGEMLLDDLI